MNEMKQMKWLGFALLPFLLVGCADTSNYTNETANADTNVQSEVNNNDSSLLPEAVKDGTVTQQVYLDTIEYTVNYKGYTSKMIEHINKIKSDNNVLFDPSFVSEFESFINEYDVFLKGIVLTPKTDADFEINRLLSNVLSEAKHYNSSMRSFITTKENQYAESAERSAGELETSQKALFNLMESYGLEY